MTTVSVVMPAYNHRPFVAQAIGSVLEQSFQDFEIVITDDASTDGTPDVIRAFSDPRIDLEVFAFNRRGFALNNCVRRARGEFVALLNSDDFFLPGKLERQVAFLRANPDVAAVFGLPRLIDEAGAPLDDGYREFTLPNGAADFSRKDWLRHFFFIGNCLCNPTMMIRRAVYDDVGRYNSRLASLPDFDMWVRVCMRNEIRVLPEELTAYRIMSGERNMSARRKDTVLRTMYEYSQVLRHFAAMPEDLARAVFAADLAAKDIDATRPMGMWLGELALTRPHAAHRAFALQSMFETATEDRDIRRLHELTGSIDIFRIAPVQPKEHPPRQGAET
jgi:glycosyltransferase involved in cell wall biosynthesis